MSVSAVDTAVEQIGEPGPRRRFSGKKMVLLVVLPLLILSGGGTALYVTGMFDRMFPAAPAEEGAEEAEHGGHGGHGPAPAGAGGYFHQLPDILANLNTGERRQVFLKVSISLELTRSSDAGRIETVMPRIIDEFQMYLRELRVEDLRGSAGLYRLREELQRRVNLAVHPVQVRQVLFREMLVQ